MNRREAIFQANHHAVYQLRRGNNRDAASILSGSLTLLKDSLSSCEEASTRKRSDVDLSWSGTLPLASTGIFCSTTVIHCSAKGTFGGEAREHVGVHDRSIVSSTSPSVAEAFPSSTICTMLETEVGIDFTWPFFSKAFAITPTDTCMASELTSNKEVTEISLVILFNLALSFHVMGMETGKSKCLLQALSFYEKAFQVLSAHAIHRGDSTIALYLALCMNAAHIHQEFFNLPQAADLYKMFKSALDWVGPYQMTDEEYNFFTLNSCFIDQLWDAHAPAA
jgi:hypothetical protein